MKLQVGQWSSEPSAGGGQREQGSGELTVAPQTQQRWRWSQPMHAVPRAGPGPMPLPVARMPALAWFGVEGTQGPATAMRGDHGPRAVVPPHPWGPHRCGPKVTRSLRKRRKRRQLVRDAGGIFAN